MTGMWSQAHRRAGGDRSFEVFCTVRVSHTFENLSAHVELDGEIEILPGDRVQVHGGAVNPPYGQVQEARRLATVTRATWLERTWIRLTSNLSCLSLIEVSFSDRRAL